MTQSIQCTGFQASGVVAGIKKKSNKDLGLIVSQAPASIAAMFTRNRVKAAPVLLSQERAASGLVRAIIANAGNANCCNGDQGMADARQMTQAVAQGLGVAAEQVLVASTGVIGAPLPIEKVDAAVPTLISELRPEGFADFAQAIMTTDTIPKLLHRQATLDGTPFTILAAAKGAGMIRPDMATMLCFICTDADVPGELLQQMLGHAVDRSLNRITIDGDTSTNDTVFLMANGLSGARVKNNAHQVLFQKLLDDLLMEIARLLVKDGEGVTKVVNLQVKGAASDADAERIADVVAHSPLVKTAFFGQDANWGRIVGAVGRAGVDIDPKRIDIYFDEVQMVQAGQGCGAENEAQVTAVMKKTEFSVVVDLNIGAGQAAILTCDFSIDYVKINADYRS